MASLNRLHDGGGGGIAQARDAMPEMVRLWAASAVTLGLAEGRIARCGQTRCLNLMLTYAEGCPAHCAYCGEAGRDVETLGLSPHAPASWPLASFLHIVDLVEAAAGDDLKATVDYGKVAAITRRAFCGAPRALVEAAALDVAQALLAAFQRIESVRVRVAKVAPPIAEQLAAVGVEIEVARGPGRP